MNVGLKHLPVFVADDSILVSVEPVFLNPKYVFTMVNRIINRLLQVTLDIVSSPDTHVNPRRSLETTAFQVVRLQMLCFVVIEPGTIALTHKAFAGLETQNAKQSKVLVTFAFMGTIIEKT